MLLKFSDGVELANRYVNCRIRRNPQFHSTVSQIPIGPSSSNANPAISESLIGPLVFLICKDFVHDLCSLAGEHNVITLDLCEQCRPGSCLRSTRGVA